MASSIQFFTFLLIMNFTCAKRPHPPASKDYDELVEPLVFPTKLITDSSTFKGKLKTNQQVDSIPFPMCFEEINAARTSNGFSTLTYDYGLEVAAKNHSEAMHSLGALSHKCPGEPEFLDRVTDAGYNGIAFSETIIAGLKTFSEVVKAWMTDGYVGNRASILGDYQNVGCAKSGSFWTCVFGKPRRM